MNIDEILDRGIIKQILPSKEEFRKKLMEGKKLKFYIGVDATAKALHLSHAKNCMILEEFRRLGHDVTILFGDFTARIGDPSDKDSARTALTKEQTKENAMYWVEQIRPLLNFEDKKNPAHIRFNGDWLDTLTPQDMIRLFSTATVQQMLERDMFQRRIKDGKPIFVHEFLYPFFQGYDSVAMDVDVELCGTDQIFNALVGRDLQKHFNNKEKFVVAVNLMENPKTGELMSKSKGTGVFLGNGANDLFGQIMAQPDEMIEILLICNTRIPLDQIKKMDITNNPMQSKLLVAREIVKIFYGEQESERAHKNFIDTFSNKSFPLDAPVVHVPSLDIDPLEIACLCIPTNSRAQNKRLVAEGAVKIDGDKVQIGKRGFFKLEVKK